MDTKVLRQKILDLAIRGKLVPQDPADEPASVLLQRIRTEKKRLVKEGKLKAKDVQNDTVIFKGEDGLHYEKFADGSVKCIEDEIPFELPEGWEWERLGNVSTIERGGSPRPIKNYITTSNDGINWIKIGDAEKGGKYIFSTKEKITPQGALKSRFVQSGDFLLTNSMSFGRPYILKTNGCIHDGWLVIGNTKFVFYHEYLYYALSASLMFKALRILAGVSTVDNLNIHRVKSVLFPLPPLAEQRRIVEKIESIFRFIDELEAAKGDLQGSIKAAKARVLDLAIRGELVPQDPADEPASLLLERIRAEKERLIKEGKIKRDKKESVIFKGEDGLYYEKFSDGSVKCIEDEIPFELPEGWEWTRLGEIANWGAGATPSKNNPEYYNNGNIPWLKTGDLNDGYITEIPDSITELAIKETSVKLNPAGAVLIAMYGATIGKLGILTFPSTTNQACCAGVPYDSIEQKYMFYYLLSQREAFIFKGVGGAQSNISKGKIVSTLIPLPPLAEQRRIVEAIEKYFALLDELAAAVA